MKEATGNRNSARSKQFDPGMGPNLSKATGELEEEESAGTALMPHPRPAAFGPFQRSEGLERPAAFRPLRRPQMFKKSS